MLSFTKGAQASLTNIISRLLFSHDNKMSCSGLITNNRNKQKQQEEKEKEKKVHRKTTELPGIYEGKRLRTKRENV